MPGIIKLTMGKANFLRPEEENPRDTDIKIRKFSGKSKRQEKVIGDSCLMSSRNMLHREKI